MKPWECQPIPGTCSLCRQSSESDTTGQITPVVSWLAPTGGQKQQGGLSVEWRQEMGHGGFVCGLVACEEVICMEKTG